MCYNNDKTWKIGDFSEKGLVIYENFGSARATDKIQAAKDG